LILAPREIMKKNMFLIILLVIFFFYLLSWTLDFSKGEKPNWGLTFSQYYAEKELGLDFKKVYQDLLNEFKVKNLRLIAYWDYLEPEKGKFNFEDLDWQIKEAEKHDKEIILVIGLRVPRWPECHYPSWAKDLPEKDLEENLLAYFKEVVNHYKDYSSLIAWQVENEPLFGVFGDCPKPSKKLLKEEINLVKSMDDKKRPILVTDSGELSSWFNSAGLSEIFGTTCYRIVWNNFFGSYKHFWPPVFYTLRAFLVEKFTKSEEVIIAELQAEPWATRERSIANIPLKEQTKYFKLKDLKDNLEFARKTGIKKIYLWGVEWWYWRKLQGDESFWEKAKEILN